VFLVISVSFRIPEDASLPNAFSLWVELLAQSANGLKSDPLTILDETIHCRFHQIYGALPRGFIMLR
jgi:hypothetical protein